MAQDHRYDVALSFAGEDRELVEELASIPRDGEINVFYDSYEQAALWGKDLYTHLDYVYRIASRYVILFVSEAYSEKVWTSHERRSAQARTLEENSEYILPVRLDETELPGLPPTIGYLDGTTTSPAGLAEHVREKLGPRRVSRAFPATPDRLWDEMGVAENAQERTRIRRVARSFHSALERMSTEERTAVCGVLAFGCPAELPERVHVSLDRLHRMTGSAKAEILDSLAAVASLNVRAATREPQHIPHDGELIADDLDVTLTFWSSWVPDARDATTIAQQAVLLSASHFCQDHGLAVVVALDFSQLSSEQLGPVVIDEDAKES